MYLKQPILLSLRAIRLRDDDLNNHCAGAGILRAQRGAPEVAPEQRFQITPNPVQDYRILKLEGMGPDLRFNISDCLGRPLSDPRPLPPGHTIGLAHLAPGMYFLTLAENILSSL